MCYKLPTAHETDGRLEIFECPSTDFTSDVIADASASAGLMNHHHTTRLAYGTCQSWNGQRVYGSHVNELDRRCSVRRAQLRGQKRDERRWRILQQRDCPHYESKRCHPASYGLQV